MSQSKKPVALALGAAVATGTLLASSMFSMQAMAQGYMEDAPAKSTAAEGKCGEGKCGGDKTKRDAASGQASGKRQHHSMADMDTDKDGRMSRAEFNAAHKGSEGKFVSYDGNSDGFISQAEMDAHHAAMKQGKTGMANHGKMGAEGKCGEGKCGGKP